MPTESAAELQADERIRDRLTALVGRRLFQFRVSLVSLVLDFGEQGDDPDEYTMWLYADEFGFTGGSDQRVEGHQRTARTSSAAVLALHALLGRELSDVEVGGGRLRMAFVDGAEVSVEPQPDAQAWAMTFERGALIECSSGGALNVRVP